MQLLFSNWMPCSRTNLKWTTKKEEKKLHKLCVAFSIEVSSSCNGSNSSINKTTSALTVSSVCTKSTTNKPNHYSECITIKWKIFAPLKLNIVVGDFNFSKPFGRLCVCVYVSMCQAFCFQHLPEHFTLYQLNHS